MSHLIRNRRKSNYVLLPAGTETWKHPGWPREAGLRHVYDPLAHKQLPDVSGVFGFRDYKCISAAVRSTWAGDGQREASHSGRSFISIFAAARWHRSPIFTAVVVSQRGMGTSNLPGCMSGTLCMLVFSVNSQINHCEWSQKNVFRNLLVNSNSIRSSIC